MRVPCEWPRRTPCKLALLGEAPGQEEADTGRPFVGPSGKLLDQMLRSAGINRADCWVGNVFEEKADGNDCGPWLRDPERLGAALQRLAGELERSGAVVVVPLGGSALQALAETDQITRMRGSPIPATRVVPGKKLLPTLHPAAVLRQYKQLPVVVGDLVKAAQEAERGPELFYPWRAFVVEPSIQTIDYWMETPECVDGRGRRFPGLLYADLLSVDIETGWGQITCIGFAPDAEHAICIPFMDIRKPDRSYWATVEEEAEVWRLVKAVLESDVPKLGQNFTYDAFWLLEKMGIRPRNYLHDTRLMHHALYPELPKDLASMAAAYSAMPGWKSWTGRGEKRDD